MSGSKFERNAIVIEKPTYKSSHFRLHLSLGSKTGEKAPPGFWAYRIWDPWIQGFHSEVGVPPNYRRSKPGFPLHISKISLHIRWVLSLTKVRCLWLWACCGYAILGISSLNLPILSCSYQFSYHHFDFMHKP